MFAMQVLSARTAALFGHLANDFIYEVIDRFQMITRGHSNMLRYLR